jgi:cysteine-rich repeat protein
MVFRLIAAVLLLMGFAASLAAAPPATDVQARSLAGQMCPQGAYVIGFDGDGNIVCSQVCGNGMLDAGERCDDGNTVAGDGCSAACQIEAAAAAAAQDAPVARQSAPAAAAAVAVTPTPSSELGISDVEPSSVVFGTREVTIRISGAGFDSGTVVLFDGASYQPTVNQAGTELELTLPTRRLAIGRYAIKVSNGPDKVVKWAKALVVF